MIRRLLASTVVLLAALSTEASAQSSAERWFTYRNERFGTIADVPRGLLPKEEPEPANGDGQAWTSADGRSRLAIYGGFNAENRTVEQIVTEDYGDLAPTFDYRRVAADWFVVSGTKDGTTFYTRCRFSTGLRVQHCIDLSYPAADTKRWDPVVARISKSLKIGKGIDD